MTVRPRRSDPRDDRGASAVEFALVMPFLLLIVFGLIQYGLYFFSSQTGSNTINVAARQLTVGNCDTAAELNTLVNNRLGSAQVGTATVTRTYYDVAGATSVGPVASERRYRRHRQGRDHVRQHRPQLPVRPVPGQRGGLPDRHRSGRGHD